LEAIAMYMFRTSELFEWDVDRPISAGNRYQSRDWPLAATGVALNTSSHHA
jgi:hypothetical protein